MDRARVEISPTQRTLFMLAALVVVVAGMRAASVLLAPALLALLIAITVVPLQQWLGHRIGRVPAYFALLGGVLVAIVVVTAVLAISGAALFAQLAAYTGRADDIYREALRLVAGVGIEPGEVASALEGQRVQSSETLLSFASEVLEAAGNFGLVILLALFMLADAVRLREKTDAMPRSKSALMTRLECLVADVRDYLQITAFSAAIVGAGATAVFALLGVPLAPLWGLLMGLLKFVPVIGFWTALVPPTALGALDKGLWWGVAIAVLTLLLNQAVEHVVKTRMIGRGLNLSPFTVIFSIVFWAFVLGPLGTILAVPLTLAVKHLAIDPDPSMRWLSVLVAARVERPQRPAAA